jgi:hypothetical protein
MMMSAALRIFFGLLVPNRDVLFGFFHILFSWSGCVDYVRCNQNCLCERAPRRGMKRSAASSLVIEEHTARRA